MLHVNHNIFFFMIYDNIYKDIIEMYYYNIF